MYMLSFYTDPLISWFLWFLQVVLFEITSFLGQKRQQGNSILHEIQCRHFYFVVHHAVVLSVLSEVQHQHDQTLTAQTRHGERRTGGHQDAHRVWGREKVVGWPNYEGEQGTQRPGDAGGGGGLDPPETNPSGSHPQGLRLLLQLLPIHQESQPHAQVLLQELPTDFWGYWGGDPGMLHVAVQLLVKSFQYPNVIVYVLCIQ